MKSSETTQYKLSFSYGLLANSEQLSPEWKYEVIHTDVKSEFIWDGKYHIYFDYWVSQVWNAMRTIRILLNEMIRDVYIKGFAKRPPLFIGAEHTAQFQRSTDVLFEMQADILATIPQHLGYVKSGQRPTPNNNTSESSALVITRSKFPWDDFGKTYSYDEPVVRMSGPYFLLWPLFLTGVMDVTTKPVSEFATKMLRTIGKNMGINQAVVLATMIENKTALW
jgi:hypothetical protein